MGGGDELKQVELIRSDVEVWASAIKFAALVIGVSLIVFGVLIGQPWAKPEYSKIVLGDDSRFSSTLNCVAYKDQLTCDWPK